LSVRNIISILATRNDSNNIKKEDSQGHKMDLNLNNINSYAVILEKNPFGNPANLQPLTGRQEAKKDERGLPVDLILVGTAVGPARMSYAILESKEEGWQEVFRIGEDIFTHGRLIKIGTDYVTIRQKDETVTLKITDINSMVETPQSRPKESTTSFIKKMTEGEYLINREKVEQSIENPQHVLTDARFLPNFKDGKQEGFKVLEIKPGGIYEGLGLRNGDILLRINDIEISSPETVLQIMGALRGMDRFNLDIMRDGNKISMNYQIR